MKFRLKDLSINTKLMWLLLSMIVVLLLSNGALIFNLLSQVDKKTQSRLAPIAAVLGYQASAALLFGDRQSVERDLESLTSQPGISAALVYDHNAQLFAVYPAIASKRPDWLQTTIEIARPQFDRLTDSGELFVLDRETHFLQPLKLQNETVGFIQLIDNQSGWWQAAREALIGSAMIAAIAAFTSLLLALWLPSFVTNPLRNLNRVVRQVSEQRDFSLRANKESADEIGQLVDGFNAMLDEVQHRDRSLEQYNQGLESLVQERTAKLHEATRMANTANEAKSRFLANISHDIRTPMSAVLGLSEVLEQTGLSAQQAKYVKQQKQAGSLLLLLIDQILDLARLERGQLELIPNDFALSDVIRRVHDVIKPLADQKSLKLRITQEEGLPDFLLGDAVRLSQVLVNLLSNAIKFTPAGFVALGITRQNTEQNDTALLSFAITDSGPGISPENQQVIFKPFLRLNKSRRGEDKGLGLGLAISQDLVQLMGGQLRVKSIAGKGSCFCFEVPFTSSVAQNTVDSREPASATVDALEHINVLLVEDEKLLQQLHGSLLKLSGVNVDIAGDGQQALTALSSNTYDLVFMDLQLPDMDGISVTKTLRQREKSSQLPIIALTADGLEQSRHRCLQAGMQDCLVKPVAAQTLRDTLLTWTHAETRLFQTKTIPINSEITAPLETFADLAGEESAIKLSNDLLGYLPEWRQTLYQALANHDRRTARKIAHKITGSSAIWHHEKLSELLQEKSGHFSGNDHNQLIRQFDQYFDEILDAVAALTGKMEASQPKKQNMHG